MEMQDKTWYSILGLDGEPLFLQDGMLKVFTASWDNFSGLYGTYYHTKENLGHILPCSCIWIMYGVCCSLNLQCYL